MSSEGFHQWKSGLDGGDAWIVHNDHGTDRRRNLGMGESCLGAAAWGDEAWGDAVHFLEDAGEVGKLLEAEVVSDGFDRFAGDDAGVSLGEANLAHPIGNGHSVVGGESALQGAEGNVAETCEFARALPSKRMSCSL